MADKLPKTLHGSSWKLDHIGHAVFSIDNALKRYQNLYGLGLVEREILREQGVEIAFLGLENCEIELLAPLPGNTTLSRFLDSRGEALHHLCFAVEDIDSELRRLADLGARLIDPKPRVGSRNTRIAFVHPAESNGVLIELCTHISL